MAFCISNVTLISTLIFSFLVYKEISSGHTIPLSLIVYLYIEFNKGTISNTWNYSNTK